MEQQNDDECRKSSDNTAVKRLRLAGDKETTDDTSESTPERSEADENTMCNVRSSDYFLLLPYEMVLYIFSKLSKADLAKNVCLVNRRFKDIVYDPSLWIELSYRQFKLKLDTTAPLFDRCTLLKKLNLKHVSDSVVPLAIKTLEVCSQLSSLTVCVTNSNLMALLKAVENSSSLYFLHMDGDWDPETLLDNVMCLTRLRHIWLCSNNNRGLDSRSLVAIGTHCKNLEEFLYSNQNQLLLTIDDETMISFLDNVKDTINSLWFYDIRVKDTAFVRLAECRLLESLVVSKFNLVNGSNTEQQNDSEFLKSILKLSNLRELYFPHFFATAEILNQVFEAKWVQNMTRWDITDYRGFNVDEVLAKIADNCPKLTYLTVSNATDVGLGKIFQKCTKLRYLDLHHATGVTSNAFKRASLLRHLMIDSSPWYSIPKGELLAIENLLPMLNITDYKIPSQPIQWTC